MTNELQDHNDLEAELLPSVDDVFVSPRISAAAPKPAPKPAPGKSAGAGDSVRGMKSDVKVLGGHDAARSRDPG